MERLFALADTPKTTTTLQQEALQTLKAVAYGWMALGLTIGLFTNNASTRTVERIHNSGGVCLLIAVAIFSVVLPLQHLLRKHKVNA